MHLTFGSTTTAVHVESLVENPDFAELSQQFEHILTKLHSMLQQKGSSLLCQKYIQNKGLGLHADHV
jgi:hypothetical protein